ncbi:MAG: MtrAB system histidine kinase MtrB [Candidatus Nanopelagicales bacterium]|jgi:two-component system, OmpR family, sensor histidine kinase MtrB|nr:MtrAB system histidine kinase MtrB [Candidatus Nanopelagicales bacterium]
MTWIRAMGRRLRSWWRGSLLVRVTSTTLVLSLLVVGVLGLMLMSRIATGLIEAAERNAVSEARAGLTDAQRVSSAVEAGTASSSPARVVDTLVAALATRAGNPPQYEVLLLSGPDTEGFAPERGTNLVATASIPLDLRQNINDTGRLAWTFTEIRYLDGASVPGIAVGAPLTVPGIGSYELYYLFPLTDQVGTLDLVRSGVVAVGALLAILLALIAWIVTRQVVTPVRIAAEVAERFSHGHLTERIAVRGEDDLARLATSFNEMAGSLELQIHQLEDLSRVQQRFVADVSHELRTPLTTIRMAADLLFENRSSFDAATSRSAELLQTQLDRFESLLTDLLEISRYDAGAAVLDLDSVDLFGLIDRLVLATAPLAERCQTPLIVEYDPSLDNPMDLDATVLADPRRLDRVLRNLLDNAVEHGERQPILITIGASTHAVAITVRDHGVGLSEDSRQHVFARFWRADPARARTTGGTGLGLAIALEDTRLHGGWLEVWGSPGQGANFRLTLPRDPDNALIASPLPLVPEDTQRFAAASDSAGIR